MLETGLTTPVLHLLSDRTFHFLVACSFSKAMDLHSECCQRKDCHLVQSRPVTQQKHVTPHPLAELLTLE